MRGLLRRPQQMSMRAPVRLKSTPYIRKLKRLSDHVEPGTPSNQFFVAFVVFTSSKGISHATSPAASGQAAAAAAAVHESQSATGAAQKARVAPIRADALGALPAGKGEKRVLLAFGQKTNLCSK